MANVDRPMGFHPVEPVLRITKYRIEAEYATALYIGDPAALVSGYINKATAGSGNSVLGFIVGFECDQGIKEGGYYPASSTDAWWALVADHPDQRFIGQDDGDGTAMSLAHVGNWGSLIFTHSGSTDTNLSGAELDGSDFSGGAETRVDQMQLIGLAETPDNEAGANANWIVQIQRHQLRIANYLTT